VSKITNSLLILLFSALIWSCNEMDSSPKALVNVLLIDAPAQWDSVIVEIQGVELELVLNGREGEIQRIFLPYEPGDKQVDISQLVGGVALPVAREELGLGKITGITLKLGSRNFLFLDETGYPLELPGGETDYYLAIEIDLEAGISYDLILDFDLEKSVQAKSTTPLSFDFKPTLLAYSGIGKGELTGTTSPTDLRPVVYAISKGDSISTHTDTGGKFLFKLAPGNYTVFVDPKDSRYRTDTIQNIAVVAGKTTTLDRITLPRK
jgi:hypothetical protein